MGSGGTCNPSAGNKGDDGSNSGLLSAIGGQNINLSANGGGGGGAGAGGNNKVGKDGGCGGGGCGYNYNGYGGKAVSFQQTAQSYSGSCLSNNPYPKNFVLGSSITIYGENIVRNGAAGLTGGGGGGGGGCGAKV